MFILDYMAGQAKDVIFANSSNIFLLANNWAKAFISCMALLLAPQAT